MGTNYYVDADSAPVACTHCGRSDRVPEPLHIGKSSSGWAFCFAPYPDLSLISWEAWRSYLLSRQERIRDEYGHAVPLVDLETAIRLSHGDWTAKTAPDTAWGPSSRDGDFIDADGYWFARSAEFS